MKRIINGVTYNTATSTQLGRSEWGDDMNPEEGRTVETLYVTNGGAYFVHEEITRLFWSQRDGEHRERYEQSFRPLSAEEAHKWMMEGEVEVFHNPFEDPPEASAEAEPAATLYIRVPAALKRRVEEAARETKMSGNVWAMRCVERCLNPSPDAKQELALVHDILQRIRAHAGDGHTVEQVTNLADEAIQELGTAWGDLGFDDPTEHSDLETRIMGHVDTLSNDRLNREYPLFK